MSDAHRSAAICNQISFQLHNFQLHNFQLVNLQPETSYLYRMKRIVTFILLVFILIGQSGCKKRLFDYRNKYVGNYAITTTVGTLTGGVYTEEQFTYQGKVYYDKKEHEKGVIVIVYKEGKECTTTIDRKGKVTFKYHGGEFYDRETFKVWFENAPNGTATEMKGSRI
jgi:hypothetical protein